MAGHSKWSSIKRKKKVKDEKRGKLFSKLANEIKMLSKDGTDVKKNFKLKNAISRALNKNINKSIIKNIIKKDKNYEETNLYAIILPDNFIFILECHDSNNKKIISDLKHLLLKFSGNLIQLNHVINIFETFVNINFINNYNEEYIIKNLSDIYIDKFIDNKILVKSEEANNIIEKLRYINCDITHNLEFIAKKKIYENNNNFNKLRDLKKKLMDKMNISNIFTNAAGL